MRCVSKWLLADLWLVPIKCCQSNSPFNPRSLLGIFLSQFITFLQLIKFILLGFYVSVQRRGLECTQKRQIPVSSDFRIGWGRADEENLGSLCYSLRLDWQSHWRGVCEKQKHSCHWHAWLCKSIHSSPQNTGDCMLHVDNFSVCRQVDAGLTLDIDSDWCLSSSRGSWVKNPAGVGASGVTVLWNDWKHTDSCFPLPILH